VIRINLLRDRKAERFAKALDPDTLDLQDILTALNSPGSLTRVNQRAEYVLYVPQSTFDKLKDPDMKISFSNKGIRFRDVRIVAR
jgi:hypothetical protein